MAVAGDIDKLSVIDQNIAYYNEVAPTYNSIIDSDSKNQVVRQKVSDKFQAFVKSGTVLDFGGGTGLDLEWLTAANYNIYFCEPSAAMRCEAMNRYDIIGRGASVVFLDEPKTDFRTWLSTPPFQEKVDGILSNFGVINYIPGINTLFHNLARVTRPGGHFVGIMVELDLRKRLKWHRRNAIQSLLFHRPFKMHIPYKEHQQAIFIHTTSEIKRASSPYFNFVRCDSLNVLDFTLIHLVRNEKPC